MDPPGLNYACKLVAVSIAWTLQRIISAFHSAVRGGQIAGDALVVMLKNAGVLKHGPHDSFADGVVGSCLLAFFGLATQIKHAVFLAFSVQSAHYYRSRSSRWVCGGACTRP